MDKAFGTAVLPTLSTKKASARVALINMKEPARNTLSECFRQFGIESVLLTGNAVERLTKEKFEACVIKLGPEAQAVMESARTSASNSRIVLYAVGGSAQDAMQYSKYGINAIFHEPLERPAVLKLVRATQMLVFHELRRYVRIPVITEISVVMGDGRKVTATSIEISSGGMSLRSAEDIYGWAVGRDLVCLTHPAQDMGSLRGDLAQRAREILRHPFRQPGRAPFQNQGMDRRLPGRLAGAVASFEFRLSRALPARKSTSRQIALPAVRSGR